MSDATPIDAALEGLSELAGCDLRLAKRFCARIEALPEDEDAKAMDLARSYQRMARSYRQTLVVQARLRRELKAEARQDEDDARAERKAAQQARDLAAGLHRQRVRRHFERVLWDEYEADDAQETLNELDEHLFEISADGGFLDTPVETLIARLIEEFGIGAGAEAADDEDPPSPAEGDENDDAPIAAADKPVSAAPPAPEPPDPQPPDPQPPEPDPPEPEPPPRPPDPPPDPAPAPYIPPWEQLPPGGRWPGSSGW